MLYYCSDPHLLDDNIIKTANRPFSCMEEFLEIFRENWNKEVRPIDTTLIAGDVASCWLNVHPEKMQFFAEYMESLNGKKQLAIGNHDRRNLAKSSFRRCFSRIQDRYEISDHGQAVFVDHYPSEDWNGMHTGTIHLHGHTHGKDVLSHLQNRYDISVDAIHFKPVSLEECIAMGHSWN